MPTPQKSSQTGAASPRPASSTEYPLGSRGVAATRLLHGLSTWQPRRRRDPPPPRKIHVAAATRLLPGISTRQPRRRRDPASAEDPRADAARILRAGTAVQGPRATAGPARPPSTATLLGLAPADRAAALGLPAGLLRTSARTESHSEASSRELFGHSGATNPAKAQRVHRERAAQRALAKARRVVAERAAKAEGDDAAATDGGLGDRFRSR